MPMPRPAASESTRQELRTQRRMEILQAAAPVFARKGFAGTKITDLMAAAQMSQGLLYRYFTSKDDVFIAIVEAAVQHSIDIARQAEARSGSPLERLRWFVETYLPPQYEHPEYALVVAHALTNEAVPAEVRVHTSRYLIEFIGIIRDLISEGQMAGEIIQRDAEQLAVHLLAALHGLAAGTAFLGAASAQEQALLFPEPEILLLALRPDHS